MKKENKSQLCPLCGGKKKPRLNSPARDARNGRPARCETPVAIVDYLAVESSDDKTANSFAALLVNHRKKRLGAQE
jgi:hypothetical protein